MENNTIYQPNNLMLTLNVIVGNSTTADHRYIKAVYYEASWQQNKTYLYELNPDTATEVLPEISTTIDLSGIPDGKHTITLNATERGNYNKYYDIYYNLHYTVFDITGSSTLSFFVDSKSPDVLVFSPENTTYSSSDVELDFALNEKALHIFYSLDGQENVTIAGNSTLTGLSSGEHSLIVYSTDEAGNIGVSETIHFVVEPFPTVIALASIAIGVIAGIGIILYFKKRRRS